jgi:hypothetical protein
MATDPIVARKKYLLPNSCFSSKLKTGAAHALSQVRLSASHLTTAHKSPSLVEPFSRSFIFRRLAEIQSKVEHKICNNFEDANGGNQR